MADWNIETNIAESEIRAFLQEYSPWRVAIKFNGRISSAEYETFQPFNRTPLNKIRAVEPHIPGRNLRGTVLDIGFNCGYNSIYLASRYDARVVGVEVEPRHQKVATRLAEMSNAEAEFHLGSAETFLRERAFDLVLHFGTLYHLPNPMLALKTTAMNLKIDGWIALETVAYTAGRVPHENLFVYGFNNDSTNFWALSKPTIETMLQIFGFSDVKLVLEASPPIYEGRMSRVIYVARKAREVARP